MAKSFLPGLHCNFRNKPLESFSGYLLRLSEENGLRGIHALLQLLPPLTSEPIRNVLEARASKRALGLLGRMAFGETDGLLDYWWKRFPQNPFVFTPNFSLPEDALMLERAQVCPLCLREDDFIHECWDYATVLACTKHKCFLVDTCERCSAPLTWQRGSVMHCHQCDADLRSMRPQGASDELLTTVEDFAARAPFRIKLNDGTTLSLEPSDVFAIVRALALDDRHWWEGIWPYGRFFSTLSLSQRACVLTRFASVRTWAGYALPALRQDFLRHLVHLTIIPSPNLPERIAFEFLHIHACQVPGIIQSLVYKTPQPPFSYQVGNIGGTPAKLRTNSDVARYIGTDIESVRRLNAIGVLHPPSANELGHSIDEVLEAQRFMHDELLPEDGLHQVIGIRDARENIPLSSLVSAWNPASSSDRRVLVSDVASLQQRIRSCVGSAIPPTNPTTLEHLGKTVGRPGLIVVAGVTKLLGNGFRHLNWGPPYTWGCIATDAVEGEHFVREL